MKLFFTKKKLVKKFAEELAYLQIRADWWFYVASGDKEENQNMSNSQLEGVTELRCICNDLGILNEVYDFRNSGKKNYVADVELIKRLDREFCEPRKKKRPLF